ncbi:MAG: phage portal protein [Lentisphaerae bacterium]|nr:phage portal protein [Lentisphaerota bacterium]
MKFRDRIGHAWKALTDPDWIKKLEEASGWNYNSASGMNVTSESAMRISTVNACVRIIAETCASLPLDIYHRLDSGGREIARKHPIYSVLHTRPNPWQTSFDWRVQLFTHLLLRGNYYALALDHGDMLIDDIIPMNPDTAKVEQLPDYTLRYTFTGLKGETLGPYPKPGIKVLHIRALSSDGVLGRSVIADARESFGAALATQEFTGKYWSNGATPSGVIKIKGKLAEGQADRIRSQWNDDHGGASRSNKLHVLSEDADFTKIDITAEDAQFIETRRFQRADIAGLFRVPMFLLQSDSNTATYASAEQFMLSFVVHCIRPWIINVEQALHRNLFSAPEFYFPEHNLDAILRGDIKSRYEAYQIARNQGILSKNEVRAKENENPLTKPEENGDSHLSLAEIQNAKKGAAL